MRLLILLALAATVIGLRDTDVDLAGARALDYSRGYVVAKDAHNIIKVVKADEAWTKADLKDAAYVFVLLPIDQALIGTASAFAKVNPQIKFILSDPKLYLASKIGDQAAAVDTLEKMLDEESKQSPLDLSEVPPNLGVFTPRPCKFSKAKSPVWERLIGQPHWRKDFYPGFLEMQNRRSKSKMRRAASSAKYWAPRLGLDGNGMYDFDCTHFHCGNIRYKQHAQDNEFDHTLLTCSSKVTCSYFGHQRGGSDRYSPTCREKCTDLELSRLAKQFSTFYEDVGLKAAMALALVKRPKTL